MEQDKKRVVVGLVIAFPLIIILLLLLLTPSSKKRVGPSKLILSDGNDVAPAIVIGQFDNNPMTVNIFSSLSRNIGKYTLVASCYPGNFEARIDVSNKNEQTFIAYHESMSSIDNTNFRFMGDIPIRAGSYKAIVNCTRGAEWLTDTTEFNVSQWLIDSLYYGIDVGVDNFWIRKINEYRGFDNFTCLFINKEVASSINLNDDWYIYITVFDDYNTPLNGAEVVCNLTTNRWGKTKMSYNAGSERFEYKQNIGENPESIQYEVNCEEINHASQENC